MSEQGTRKYIVSGYVRTAKLMTVYAGTAGEAIEKAKAGIYDDADTEPGPNLYSPKWTAKLHPADPSP